MKDSCTEDHSLLLSGLRHPDKAERASAMKQLVQIGNPVLPGLITCLSDDDWVVRYRAAEALGKIKNPDALSSLVKHATDPKDHVRYMVAKALGELGDQGGISTLESLLDDEHTYTRGIAAESLLKLHSLSSLEILIQAEEKEQDQTIKTRINAVISSLKE